MLLALLLQAAAPPPQSRPAGPQQPAATMVIEPAAMLLATFDADGDGRTSRTEMAAGIRRTFAAIDTARAGRLGYLAFADWAERWLGDRNALPSPFETDTDGDNQITEAELEAQFGRIFDRLDKDHDGYLTRAELLTIRSGTGERGGPGGRHGRGRGRAGPPE